MLFHIFIPSTFFLPQGHGIYGNEKHENMKNRNRKVDFILQDT